MKRNLCFLLIAIMVFSLLIVSCSPETEAEKEETFTTDNAQDVAKDTASVGVAVASAVNALDFKNNPCTLKVDIASTTDNNLSLYSDGSRTVRDASSTGESYKEISLTYDIGNVTTKGLSKIAYSLAGNDNPEEFTTKDRIENSKLYTEFKNLFESGELHFKGDLINRILNEVKTCSPDVTVEILIGANGANGKLAVTASFTGTGSDIKVQVKSAVLTDKSGTKLITTEGAEFSVTFGDDFDVILKLDEGSIKFDSIKGGVEVAVKKLTLKTLAFLTSSSFDVSGSVSYNFTSKAFASSLTCTGKKLDAGVKIKCTLSDKSRIVSSIVDGLTITKLSYDGTAFDVDSVNTVLATRRDIIKKALESYLDGSALSSVSF